ncbi:hypothetical protein FJZ23_00910 [Candidatus Parcubacteria bacterium]|nr:hypothetical protein [Candidatus Parcubacteria bacterium]
MKQTPITVYRRLVLEALETAWRHKPLWVFGLFAGLISTGGVVDIAITGVRRIHATGSLVTQWFDHSFIGYAYASQFILHLQRIGSNRVGVLLTLVTLVCLFLLAAGVLSQAALVHGTGAGKGQHPRRLRAHVLQHFWSVLTIGLIAKAISLTLLIAATLPLVLFMVEGPSAATAAFLSLMLYIPAAIVLHILTMLAIIDAVEANAGASHAIAHALSLFRRHWLSAAEFGLLLFLLVLFATLLFIALLGALSLPYGLAYTASVAKGSTALYLLTNAVAGLIMVVLLAAFSGASVTFQYGAWRLFYARAVHPLHGKKPFAKLWRLMFASAGEKA